MSTENKFDKYRMDWSEIDYDDIVALLTSFTRLFEVRTAEMCLLRDGEDDLELSVCTGLWQQYCDVEITRWDEDGGNLSEQGDGSRHIEELLGYFLYTLIIQGHVYGVRVAVDEDEDTGAPVYLLLGGNDRTSVEVTEADLFAFLAKVCNWINAI